MAVRPDSRAVECVALTRDLEGVYEEFVQAEPEALVYHTLGWRNVLRDVLPACVPMYRLAMQGDQVAGVLPAMELAGVLNSLPYHGSIGGELARGAPLGALRREWKAMVGQVRAATMISNPMYDPAMSFPVQRGMWSEKRQAQLTRLDQPLEIEKSAWRNHKKATRRGVEVARGQPMLAELERLHNARMKTIGGRRFSSEFYRAVDAHLDYDLWTAWADGEMIAGLLVAHAGSTTSYLVPAVDEEYKAWEPMAAILAVAMENAKRRGSLVWNWGGSSAAAPGVARFKRKWGGRDATYWYHVQVNDQVLLRTSPEELQRWWPGFYVAPYDRLGASL